MFFKLSIRNVKRSVKDYAIYFLTLTFGICIFYLFNSIQSQKAMLAFNEVQGNLIDALGMMIGYVSVFISFILGFLVIYANKFLIKRRKKELGIYLTLGMSKGRISRMLFIETLIIGFVSLLVGLFVGVFLSQGLSVITAKMFAVSLKSFRFIFSSDAFIKTLVYFGIIYLIVIVFNFLSISRFKLIDLLNADKKSEKLRMKRLWVSVILFIVSVICLAIAYNFMLVHGMLNMGIYFNSSILLGIIGTLLFFRSLSGFLLEIVQANKNIYLKNLNMFILRQINSKINTTYVSMTLICLMLLVTIGTLSTGMGMSTALTQDIKSATPYDATIYHYNKNSDLNASILDNLQAKGISLDTFSSNYVETKFYDSGITYKDIIIGHNERIRKSVDFKAIMKTHPDMMTVSAYNHLLKMQGKSPIELNDHQFILNCNYDETKDAMRYFMQKLGEVKIGQIVLKAKVSDITENAVQTSNMLTDPGTLVVPDSVVEGCKIVRREVTFDFKSDAKQFDTDFRKTLDRAYKNVPDKQMPYSFYMTRDLIYEQGAGLKTIISYLAIYIGLVFLITCAAVLALQQLSESSDNVFRYNLLRKIGAEQKLLNRSLFTQIAIYFLMPLSLAIVHSIIGLKAANDIIVQFGHQNIIMNIVYVSIFFVLIYGGYFLATYLGSKSILKSRSN